MKKKKIIISITCLSIISVIAITSCIIYNNYKKELESKEEFRSGLAIYTSTDGVNYYKSYDNSFIGYTINKTKSKCYDSEGNTISNAISISSNGELIVTTNDKTYCDIYLYTK